MMSSSYGYGDMMGSFGISTGAILILILIVAVVYLLCKIHKMVARNTMKHSKMKSDS